MKLRYFVERFWPLILWTGVFLVSGVIRVVAFASTTVWFDLPHEAGLWSLGVLMADATSERLRAGVRLNPQYSMKTNGELGFEVKYKPTLTGNPVLFPQTVVTAFLVVLIWIVSLILALYAQRAFALSVVSLGAKVAIGLSYLFGAAAVVMAVRTSLTPELPSAPVTSTEPSMEIRK